MKYIKSAGCFSLFYVILYFILSTGMGIFITNTYLLLLYFMVFYSLPLFFILRSVEMIQRRHYECIRSILVHFSRDPSCLYDPSSCRVYYYDRQFVFQDVTTNTMTQKVMQSLGLSVLQPLFFQVLWKRYCSVEYFIPDCEKLIPSRESYYLLCFWYSSYELSAVFLCILFGYRIWMLIRSNGFHFATITAHMILMDLPSF